MHFENRPRGALSVLFAALFLANGAAFAQKAENPPPPDPTGEWLVAKKVARIRIVDCDNRMWGVVSWEARPGIDRKNPDKGLSTRPTLGIPILLGMNQSEPNKWQGEIYNSEDGRKYDASISLLDPNTLKVQGCVLGFLCGGENWSRLGPSDSERADQTLAPPGPKQKLNKQKPAKPQASRQNGIAQSAKPPANNPPSGQPGATGSGNAAVTPETLDAEPAADICSRVAGIPGLAH